MHISHPNLTGDQMLQKLKIQETNIWWMAAILKIEKSRCLQIRLANFAEFFTMTHITHPELTFCSKM